MGTKQPTPIHINTASTGLLSQSGADAFSLNSRPPGVGLELSGNGTTTLTEKIPDNLYDCAICYDKIQPDNHSKTKCGHYFCRTCLDAWLGINTTCPMCRTVIRERQPPTVVPPIQRTGRISFPTHRIDNIPPPRREIVRRNIIERYTWEQYFMASNDLKNNEFIPDSTDINKSSYAPADFGNNIL